VVSIAGSGERAVAHAVYRLLEGLSAASGPSTAPSTKACRSCRKMAGALPSCRNPPWRVRAYATDMHTYHYAIRK
jgi:hypothetical protein